MAKDTAVYLSKSKSGKDVYWKLLWRDDNGKNHCQSIGNVKKLSKRQAEKFRREKEQDFSKNPGRRNVSRAPTLTDFLDQYFKVRTDLRPGTVEIHQHTRRYLVGYFGEHRRTDTVKKIDADMFRAALGEGKLKHVNKNTHTNNLSPATVDMHMRNARTMFEHAETWDFVLYNPFKTKKGQNHQKKIPPKAWHEVAADEFKKLMEKARPDWRLLLALCRYAGLRRAEALGLKWNNIDWENSRLRIIDDDDFQTKDKESRIVPIAPKLRAILSETIRKPGDFSNVIPSGSIKIQNITRDFTVLCQRAGVKRYHKPLHTLRKTCLTAWAREFPQHVVAAWAGHGNQETTAEYYLKVSEQEYRKAAGHDKD
ncbi:tyrosine-type recombinase/integrase [Planctomycetota bacterium]